jgi:hypothetical protein
MYNVIEIGLNNLAAIDPEVCIAKCKAILETVAEEPEGIKAPSVKKQEKYNECMKNCGWSPTGIKTSGVVNRSGVAIYGAQNFLNNQALTVSAPKPLVSPARVNPTFSQIPAYSIQAVPFTAYGDNSTYGTYNNPIRLGNTEPAVDNTPDIFKKENLTKTIGITAGILVVGYFAYKEFGGKKGTRRRR